MYSQLLALSYKKSNLLYTHLIPFRVSPVCSVQLPSSADLRQDPRSTIATAASLWRFLGDLIAKSSLFTMKRSGRIERKDQLIIMVNYT